MSIVRPIVLDFYNSLRRGTSTGFVIGNSRYSNYLTCRICNTSTVPCYIYLSRSGESFPGITFSTTLLLLPYEDIAIEIYYNNYGANNQWPIFCYVGGGFGSAVLNICPGYGGL